MLLCILTTNLAAEMRFHKGLQANQQDTGFYVSLRIQALRPEDPAPLKMPNGLGANVAFGNGVNYHFLL